LKLVLILNMGGGEDKAGVKTFLLNMFKDPAILPIKNNLIRSCVAQAITTWRYKTAAKNYDAIGGKSPIGELTRELVEKLNAHFERENSTFSFDKNKNLGEVKFDYVFNYTPPFASEVLAKYTLSEKDTVVLLPLYPHDSVTTNRSSVKAAKVALEKSGFCGKVVEIQPFFEKTSFCELIADDIENALGSESAGEVELIFSAHSLPQKVINSGDLYEAHVKSHVALLNGTLLGRGVRFKAVRLAYQSRLGPVKWLTPNLSDVLPKVEGKKALIYPISFCVDNSETDFELGVEYAAVAKDFDFYRVVKAPNSSDAFVRFLSNLVLESL